jgi:hypothetical protein
MPGEAEDFVDGAWRVDEELLARRAVPAAHVERAHVLKQVEAALIASGIPLTAGLLYEEAEATGVELAELAATVLDRASDFMAAETSRRVAIAQARKVR